MSGHERVPEILHVGGYSDALLRGFRLLLA